VIFNFALAIGFLVALAATPLWGPLVGLTPTVAFVYTVIAGCALWLALHVAEFIGICITGGR
jgi:hypothetical protein